MSDDEIGNIKDFLTIEDAAHLVGLSHWTIRMYLTRRWLTKYRFCNRTVVSRKELLALVHVEEIVPASPSARQTGAATSTAAPTPKKEAKP